MERSARAPLIPVIIACTLMRVACWAQATQPTPLSPAIDPEVDRILTRLEEREVRDLHAAMSWSQQFVVEEGVDKKTGQLWFKRFEPVPRFLAEFDRKIDRASRPIEEKHLFDGVWYEELKRTDVGGTVGRKQVRRTDDPANPFEVGVGPFPLPFGQKKSRILSVFTVTREPSAKDDPEGTTHLRLIPRAGVREAETYAAVDFWIATEGKFAGLPIKVRAAKKDGTGAVNVYVTVEFDKIELNSGLSDSVFKIDTPPGFQRLPDEPLDESEPQRHSPTTKPAAAGK